MRIALRPERSHAALAAVALVAVAAIASGLAGLDAPALAPPRTSAADATDAAATTAVPRTEALVSLGALEALPLPAPGELPGRIVLLGDRCTGVRAVDLARMGPPQRLSGPCTAVLSASGTRLVGVRGDNGRYQFAGLELAVGAPGAGQEPLGLRAGYATGGDPAVSDGGAVATCVEAPSGRVETTLVRAGAVAHVRGCWPAFAGERLLVGRARGRAAVVDGDGRVVLDLAARPRRPIGRVVPAVAPALAGGEALLAVVHDTPSGKADVLVTSLARPGTPLVEARGVSGGQVTDLRLAPGGRALAVQSGGAWRLVAWGDDGASRGVDAVAGRAILGAAFAPDGRAAAVATRDGIVIVDLPSMQPRAAIPGAARDVTWAAA